MIIIDNNFDEFSVSIPNNLTKSDVVDQEREIYLKNTETKKEYIKKFIDYSATDMYYLWVAVFSDIPVGEYEYEIDGNRGLLRIESKMGKKVYDEYISFKSYEG